MIANVVGLIYAIIGFFFSFWPGSVAVGAESMNWACLVWGALLCCSALFGIYFALDIITTGQYVR